MKKEDYAVKEGCCPYCGKSFNAAANMKNTVRPRPGDWSVCIACAAVLVFNEDLTVRKPTAQESEQSTTIPQIFKMQMIVRARLAAKNGTVFSPVGRA